MSLRRGSHRRIEVSCDVRRAPDCRQTWTIEERLANETRAKNDGKILCSRCSIAIKRRARSSPNARHETLDDGLLAVIDTELKAYLLGWIASDGSLRRNTIAIYVHAKDQHTIRTLRDAVCGTLPLSRKGASLIGFAINSRQIVRDACRHLSIEPGKKSATVAFPALSSAALTWAFLRGYFDAEGAVSSVDASLRRASVRQGWPAPRCSITSNSPAMLDAIARFCGTPAHRSRDKLEWSGTNALDFLGRLYQGATLRLGRKFDLYIDWCTWVPAIRSQTPAHPLFKWARTLPDAVAPSKASVSDSGYDLTLLERSHRHGEVEFFRTGVKVQPAFGWYFDLVPRSSISKSGYMLANSVGVIDRSYTGEVLVPLVKIDKNAPDLSLPARLVQIIPRVIIHAEIVEVDILETTQRGTGGFGSTG